MNDMTPILPEVQASENGKPLNVSRRGFLGASLGALVLGVTLSGGSSPGAGPPGVRHARHARRRIPGNPARQHRAVPQRLHRRRPGHLHRHGADRRRGAGRRSGELRRWKARLPAPIIS